MKPFREKYSFDDRLQQSSKIMVKYPDRLPIICSKHPDSKIQPIDKEKYLVPSDLTIGQFIFVIRKRIKLEPINPDPPVTR